MMSATEGEGVMEKADIVREVNNFTVEISSKCGQGGRGSKNSRILRMSLMGSSPIQVPNAARQAGAQLPEESEAIFG